MKNQLKLIVFTIVFLPFVGCKNYPDKKWAQVSYSQHKDIIKRVDSFLLAEFKKYNPISESARANIFDSKKPDSNNLVSELNTIDQVGKNIEQQNRRHRIFVNHINKKLESMNAVKFWRFHYKFNNDNSLHGICSKWTGTYHENIDPDNGFQLDDKKIGWGLFQPIDENGNYETKETQGLHIKWIIKYQEANLFVELVIFD